MTQSYDSEKPENKYHKGGEKQAATSVTGQSTRPSTRSGFESPETAGLCGESDFKGTDSIPISGIASPKAARDVHYKNTRLSRAQLEQIEAHLTARDHAVFAGHPQVPFSHLCTDWAALCYRLQYHQVSDPATKYTHETTLRLRTDPFLGAAGRW